MATKMTRSMDRNNTRFAAVAVETLTRSKVTMVSGIDFLDTDSLAPQWKISQVLVWQTVEAVVGVEVFQRGRCILLLLVADPHDPK